MSLSTDGSVIGPLGPSTLSVTCIGSPTRAVVGAGKIETLAAPCQKTVAVTSERDGDERRLCDEDQLRVPGARLEVGDTAASPFLAEPK